MASSLEHVNRQGVIVGLHLPAVASLEGVGHGSFVFNDEAGLVLKQFLVD